MECQTTWRERCRISGAGQRYPVTIYDGLTSAYKVSNSAWWSTYQKTWEEKKAQAASEKASNDYVTFTAGRFGGADSFLPIDQALTQKDMDAAKAGGADTAFYTVSRVSGEGADRAIDKGEYYLSDVERANIELMAKNFDKAIVLLNVGGVIDTKFYDEIKELDGMVLVSQAGMEGGNAMADWGSEANSVVGAAGETTQRYGGTLGIPNTVEADGPAGVRVTPVTTDADGKSVYNYCTAFPIRTMLAQTWNIDLLTRVGQAIGEEMAEIGITLWLAPGMNIHRDPLCGRNFEYYSEDPALTGFVGSCITAGVQSNKGVGVTIKHYITNNQETNRSKVNTSVSERALREIYLKGFEMVVRSAQPMAIMSSYNKVNGVYACENFDLLESIPRGEWGFDGMVMTDWGAGGRASIDGQMHAGNDLVMPGRTQQRVIDALAGTPSNDLDSALILGDVQKCASRVLTMVMRSLQFGRMYDSVDVKAHTSTYDNLISYRAESKAVVKSAAVNKLEIPVRSNDS
ncbi:MAG: glycoside hydrolase family 3 N-terminal domain-containing protein [Hominisplanchenecus sp.]